MTKAPRDKAYRAKRKLVVLGAPQKPAGAQQSQPDLSR